MKPLRIIVLEEDKQKRLRLVNHVNACAPGSALASSNDEDALNKCIAEPADLLMCGQVFDHEKCSAMLRAFSRLPRLPAITFHGNADQVEQVEYSCLRFGLIYLGYLGPDLSEDRLRRVLELVRIHRQATTP